jgi:glycosyl transferase family 25
MFNSTWRCFVINLDRSPARLRSISAQLEHAGIAFRRFAAIDGSGIDLAETPYFERRGYELRHGKTPTKGEVGCFLSHIGVLRAFLETGAAYCLILEDDAIVDPRLARTLAGLQRVSHSWDVTLLYGNYSAVPQTLEQVDDTHELVGFLGRQTGAVAYVVNRRAARIYVEKLLPMTLPIDVDFDRAWDLGIKFRGVMPFPVRTAAHPSDIGLTGRKFSWYARLPTYLLRTLNEANRAFHYAFVDPIWLAALRYRFSRHAVSVLAGERKIFLDDALREADRGIPALTPGA